jgi:serine/threonine protein kinase
MPVEAPVAAKTLTATLEDGRTIEYEPEVIGEGGMKRVHFTPDRKSVVCFFKDASMGADPQRRARLQSIVGLFNPTTDPEVGDYWRELFCWPTGIITKPEIGVVAPTYAANFFFTQEPFKGKEKQASWFTSPKLRRFLPPQELGDWRRYIHISTRLARAVRRMHLAGLAHSDLSNRNVLIDPQTGTAVIIDIDSLVVPRIYPPDVLGTPGYIAPEVLATQHLEVSDPNRNLPSILTDRHALAVLLYEYLLGRHPLRGPKVNSTRSAEEDERLSMGERALWIENPTDQSNRPKDPAYLKVPYTVTGPFLSPLFVRAFVDGLHNPDLRPDAGEWERALVKTTDLLYPCPNPNCQSSWFVFEPSHKRCPWCDTPVTGQVPTLHFYREGNRGQFKNDNARLVVFHHQRLFAWHIYDNQYAGERANRAPQAYFALQDGHWWLVNQSKEPMIVVAGSRTPHKLLTRGEGEVLREGTQVRLSRAAHGRLAVIQMA